MTRRALIAGGGIGGMAAALACAHAGWQVRLFERAAEFSEVGAGIQIGPNVTRVLQEWGMDDALRATAAFPSRLVVRDAISGRELGAIALGQAIVQRYGAPYATIHRADLHGMLRDGAALHPGVRLQTGSELSGFEQDAHRVRVRVPGEGTIDGELLVGADGLRSGVRAWLLADGPPRVIGHVAYRAMVEQGRLPAAMRSQQIIVWLAPRLHLVQYPVRGGEWLNVVAVVQGEPARASVEDEWDQGTAAGALHAALEQADPTLRDLVASLAHWRRWTLCDRLPMQGPHQHVQGRVVLVGDAAHPMRPYLAQGAGMAIEDAQQLGRLLSQPERRLTEALGCFAEQRWQRNRRVQLRSIRNGSIFHAQGVLRAARNAAMRLLGDRLLDLPWLYRG